MTIRQEGEEGDSQGLSSRIIRREDVKKVTVGVLIRDVVLIIVIKVLTLTKNVKDVISVV